MRLYTSHAGGTSSIPNQELRAHMLCSVAKINKKFEKKEKKQNNIPTRKAHLKDVLKDQV